MRLHKLHIYQQLPRNTIHAVSLCAANSALPEHRSKSAVCIRSFVQPPASAVYSVSRLFVYHAARTAASACCPGCFHPNWQRHPGAQVLGACIQGTFASLTYGDWLWRGTRVRWLLQGAMLLLVQAVDLWRGPLKMASNRYIRQTKRTHDAV